MGRVSGTAEAHGPLGAGTWAVEAIGVSGQGQIRGTLKGTAMLPIGPGSVEASGLAGTDGTLDLGLKGVTHIQRERGQWTVEGGAIALNVLRAPQVTVNAQVTYASTSGWGAFLSGSVPAVGAGQAHLSAGVSYTAFIPTSEALADALAGADPTARTVRVISEARAGETAVGLSGIQLKGCDQQVQTDAHGEARLTGPAGSCEVTVDVQSLPAEMVLAVKSANLAAGGHLTFEVQAATSAHGRVQYTDPDTGALVEDGPARILRLNLSGPESRWTNVTMPGGAFDFTGLPPGTYQLALDGEAPITVVLPGAAPALIRTFGPKRTVLAPDAVTPSVRLTWTQMVVPAGQAPRLQVTGGAPLAAVTVEMAGKTLTFGPDGQADARSWTLALPVPAMTGSVPVDVTVQFVGGARARRTTQIIMTP
ncbi:hypothetical protein [Deinococcus sp. SM5_A1]|uniref:hypothetical protein n=1 Tax=Deinococcus sp. SM5_A1 TaxID=3379094 RepID=UPI00386F57E0